MSEFVAEYPTHLDVNHHGVKYSNNGTNHDAIMMPFETNNVLAVQLPHLNLSLDTAISTQVATLPVMGPFFHPEPAVEVHEGITELPPQSFDKGRADIAVFTESVSEPVTGVDVSNLSVDNNTATSDTATSDTATSDTATRTDETIQVLQFTSPQFDLAPGGVDESKFIVPTGSDNIDGLLENRQWSQSSISYSFPDELNQDYGSDYDNYNLHLDGFTPAPPGLQAAAKHWLGDISNVVPLSFLQADDDSGDDTSGGSDTVLDDGDATIRIAMSNDPIPAYAYLPHSSDEAGDVWFNHDDYGGFFTQAQIGEYGWHTVGHELGHALGLKHGHEQGGVAGVALPSVWDSMEFTLMTYRTYEDQELGGPYTNAYGHFAQSPMLLDILALQTLYGANFMANAGDTVYQFSATTGELSINGRGQGSPVVNTIFRTLWDGNGTDTYDLSNYTTPLLLDLTPGGYLDLDVGGTDQRANLNGLDLGTGPSAPIYARGHVFNAFLFNDDPRSLIENAIGGTGDDHILGNRANNRLEGGAGTDSLNGNDGDDVLLDGDGEDWLTGGDGADQYVLAADGQLDHITDFDGGRDRLDLTAWQISDATQLSVSGTATGTQLQYQQEILHLEGMSLPSFDLATVIGLPASPISPPTNPALIHHISGQVRRDYDEDGNLTDADIGLGDVEIHLFVDADQNGNADGAAIATTTTDAYGRYRFNYLVAGQYIVATALPLDYESGADVDGADLGQIEVDLANLTAPTLVTDQDFLALSLFPEQPFGLSAVLPENLVDIQGSNGQNVLQGTNVAERFYGQGGGDTIFGKGADDVLLGENGSDKLVGEGGSDRLVGGNGNDLLIGSTDVSTLASPNDSLAGGNEIDIYVGGAGRDSFVLGDADQTYYTAAGRDDYVWIRDFQSADDTLVLHGSANQYSTAIANGHTELWLRPTAGSPAELVAYFAQTPNIALQGDSILYV